MAKKNTKNIDRRTLLLKDRDKPTTGQSGELLDFAYADMNDDERAIVEALTEMGGASKIKIIAEEAGFGRKKDVAHLRVRNGVRRLVCGQWIENVERGTYRLTAQGRRRSRSAEGSHPAEKPAKKVKAPKANGHDKNGFAAAVIKLGISAKDGDVFKVAQVVLAAKDFGLSSDSKVAKAVGVSRGYVIPRLKRLKKVAAELAAERLTKTAVLALVDAANGVEI